MQLLLACLFLLLLPQYTVHGLETATSLRSRHVQRQSPSPTSSARPLPSAPTVVPTTPPSPVPTPMDLQLSYALSTSCLSHLSSLLSSPTFVSCLPFSLLLTTSTGFASMLSAASASDDYLKLNDLLAYVASPQPNGTACDEFMADAYNKMGGKSPCAQDLGKKGAATEARAGLGSAGLMRKAVGLKDPDLGTYCYLEAVASDRPDDLYLWSLPAGISLPPSTKPTCSKCSALLLNHLAFSATSTPSLNGTLVNHAIATINGACGPAFAQYSVAPPTSGAPPPRSIGQSGWVGLLGVVLATASTSLILGRCFN